MDNYLTRLASFFSFPFSSPVSTIALAEAGFHYTGSKDEVLCHLCNMKYSGWKKHDVPTDIHKKVSPNCTFLLKSNEKLCNGDHGASASFSYGSETQQEGMKCAGSCRDKVGVETVGGATGGPVDHVTNEVRQTKKDQTMCGQQQVYGRLREIDFTKRNGVPQNGSNSSMMPVYSGSPSVNGRVRDQMNTMILDVPDNRMTEGNPRVSTDSMIYSRVPDNQMTEGTRRVSTDSMTYSREPEIQRSGEDFPSSMRSEQDPIMTMNSHVGTDSQVHVSQELVSGKPRYPQFAILSVRIATYRNWPSTLNQKPEELAKAGLFYEGSKDYVRCFQCAGGLREWEPEDDPIIEHARWFPFCEFMRLIKGDQFIMGVQAGTIKAVPKEPTPKHEFPSAPKREFPSALKREFPSEHPAVLSVMEMGYKKATIGKALQLFTQRKGQTLDAQTLLSIVWEIVDDDGCISDDEQSSKAKEFIPDDTPNTVDVTKSSDSVTKEYPVLQDASQLEEENRVLRERKTCKVCLDEEASIVFLPCGHLVTCPMCASALQKCPICRSFIRGTVKAIVS